MGKGQCVNVKVNVKHTITSTVMNDEINSFSELSEIKVCSDVVLILTPASNESPPLRALPWRM
jgi:hypothetical protein